jgi:GxxExxY protein
MLISPSPLVRKVIGCAIHVHRELGPGLLESPYQQRLAQELTAAGIQFRREVIVPITYRELTLDHVYRVDFIIPNGPLLEIKSVQQLLPVHTAQVLTYLKLLDLHHGLLMNFNVPVLVQGIRSIRR